MVGVSPAVGGLRVKKGSGLRIASVSVVATGSYPGGPDRGMGASDHEQISVPAGGREHPGAGVADGGLVSLPRVGSDAGSVGIKAIVWPGVDPSVILAVDIA